MSTPESAYLKPVVVSFPVTRYQCWVCDWHHDTSGPAYVCLDVEVAMRRWYAELEDIVREHLLTHAEPDRHGSDPLLGWLSMRCFYSLPGCPEPACACRCHGSHDG